MCVFVCASALRIDYGHDFALYKYFYYYYYLKHFLRVPCTYIYISTVEKDTNVTSSQTRCAFPATHQFITDKWLNC